MSLCNLQVFSGPLVPAIHLPQQCHCQNQVVAGENNQRYNHVFSSAPLLQHQAPATPCDCCHETVWGLKCKRTKEKMKRRLSVFLQVSDPLLTSHRAPGALWNVNTPFWVWAAQVQAKKNEKGKKIHKLHFSSAGLWIVFVKHSPPATIYFPTLSNRCSIHSAQAKLHSPNHSHT